jgi:two-component system, OmpR family, sensor histidine kinase KdpD
MPSSPSNETSHILVALGSEARTLRLVHAAFRMAREQGRPWIAVHVEVLGWETAEEADQARVWLQEAHELGAEVVWIKSSSVVNGLSVVVQKWRASTLVMGRSRGSGPWDRLEHAKSQELLRRTHDLRIVVLPLDVSTATDAAPRTWSDALSILAASGVLLIVCGIFAAALSVVGGYPAIPGVFAIGVGFILHRWGWRFSLPATIESLLIYAYYFDQPRGVLTIEDWPKFLYFSGTLLVVQVLVDLVGKLRQETRAGRRREAEMVLLMLLGRALARCSTEQEVAEVLVQRLQSLFQAKAWLLIPAERDTWTCLPESTDMPVCPPPSVLLPEFGQTTVREDPLEPLWKDGCYFVALASTRGTEGLLQLKLSENARFSQASWGSLQAFTVQGALALERVRWVETAHAAHLENETERMRSSLLSAVSHDLRTPLAAIQGAASSLLLPSDSLPTSARRDMLAMIHDESEHLAQLLSNLLDLTRLESGTIRARKEWQPLDEVVGAALRRTEASGKGMEVRVSIPEDLPFVPLDEALAEQLLINLLVNARRYAPESPVDLRAWGSDNTLELEVADRGPGIPEAFRERVFDKFFRVPGSVGEGGVGIGLAICDAIAKAHGGRIWAEERSGGGAAFRISLPLDGKPPALSDYDIPIQE